MIILFFIVIFFNVISAEDHSDTKFIENLSDGDKKEFLNKVARRILEEVPEVESGGSAQVDGDVLDEKLEEQSDFVKRILKEEVDNLKVQRRHNSDLRKDKSNENENKTSSEGTGKVIARSNSTVTDDKKSGHIDLTLRTERLKRNDDTNVNHSDGTKNDSPAHDKNTSSNELKVPVKVNLRDKSKSEVRESSVVKSKESKGQDAEKNISKDDVKESSKKDSREREKDRINFQSDKSKNSHEIAASDNAMNVTESKGSEKLKSDGWGSKSENVHNTKSTVGDIDVTSQKTIKLLDNVSSNRALEDIGFTTTTEIVDTSLIDVTINDAENKKKENSTLLIKTDAVLKENEENYTTTKPASSKKYKLKMQVVNKTGLINQSGKEKSAESININSSNSTEYLENKSSIENKTEHNNMAGNVTLKEDTPHKPEIYSTLTTTEDSYKSTSGSSPAPSIQKVSKISEDSNTIINNNKLDKIVQKNITSTLDINNLDTVPTLISSTTPKTIERENNANLYNNITIINVNQTRIMTTNGNHSRYMKENIENSDTLKVETTKNKVEANIDDKTGSTLRHGSQDAQSSESDELSHVLTHFGDLEVEKVYRVNEVDPNKPAFIQHHKQKINIEQPRYAPVYNYDPKLAYFSAYNHLGPNPGELDNDNVSENNLRVLESKGSPNYIDMDYYFDRNQRIEKETKRIFRIPVNQQPHTSHHDDSDDNRSDIEQKLPKIKKKPENNAYGYWKEVPQTSSDSDDNNRSEIKHQPPKIKKKPKNNDHLIIPDSADEDHPFDLHKKGLKDNLQGVRNVFYQNKVFGYVPNRPERIEKWIHNVKDLYNNALGKSTEEVLINAGTDIIYKPHLRMKDDNDGDVFNDAMEDMGDDEKNSISTTKQLEAIFIKPDHYKDINKILRSFKGDEGDPKYYWNKEEEYLIYNNTRYDLKKLVPQTVDGNYKTLAQWDEVRAPFYRYFNALDKISNSSLERFHDVPEEAYKKAKMHLFEINRKHQFLNSTDLINMVKAIDKVQKAPKNKTVNPRSKNLHGRTKKGVLLKSAREFNTTVHKINVSNHYDMMQNAPKNVDSMAKISYITPAVDIVTNAIKMWNETMIKPALRSTNNELKIFLIILKDFVAMHNSALEKYDWLGTTVDIQAALTKLKELKQNEKRGHYIHPSDFELLKYTEELFKKAKQLESGDDQETSRTGQKVLPESRGAFPKRHKKIKKPLKAWEKVRALIMRLEKKNENDEYEEFLNDLQDSLKDFHTAIKEISMITKYDNQKWYKNIKELYLDSAGDKEYLELLLHLIVNRLFGLIEESAINGAERVYKKYIEDNRAEVDRTEAEFILILKVLKEIKQQKG